MAYQPELEKLERRYADEPAKNFAQLAEAYRRGGRVDEALDLLLMHLEERPTYVSALIVLGRCYLDKDQLFDAAQAFERVLAVDGENIIALKVLAEIAQRQGNAAQARGWLTRLLEVDPMNEEAEAQMAALAAAPSTPEAVPELPTEEIVIERASTEIAAPTAEEAAQRPPDLELETAPAADVSMPEQSDERSPVERFEEPLWSGDMIEEAGEAAEAEAGERVFEVEGSFEPEGEPAAADADAPADIEETVELQPFDTELAWGTGERMSREITPEDLAEAEAAHEEALDAPVQELPGLEYADVPAPEEAHEVAPAEGLLSEELARAAEAARPLPGLEATEMGAEDAPETGESEGAGEAEEAVEADAAGEPRGSLAGLPVFMPESVAGDESDPSAGPPVRRSAGVGEEEGAEPEPVVTETMAELYARQGLVAEAKDVYRRLLADRPDDERLQQRLSELERRRTTPTPAADPRARYEAARTGGVGARDFLRAVLEGRATTVGAAPVEADAPSPMDEVFSDEPLEPRGAPTRPAEDQPSLAGVFGEESPAPPSSPPPAPPSPSRGGVEGGFSFDQFFGEPSPGSAGSEESAGPPVRRSGGRGGSGGERSTRPSADEIDDTDESFKAWLKGLKS